MGKDFQTTPASLRTHIAFFGCTNAGKSSLINKIANQDVSIVSDVKGTTADAVKKSMEILPLGPVVLIDTAGIDDDTILGQKRIEKTYKVLESADIALLVVDSAQGTNKKDLELVEIFKTKNIPYIVVYNKSDLADVKPDLNENEIMVSAKKGTGIEELKEKIAHIISDKKEKFIIKDRLNEGDIVVLCIPVDTSAPKGRLIMPQQLVIREILDKNAICAISQHTELERTLKSFNKKPKMVITDSQVFEKIKDIVPSDIILTSFSILFANFKGDLKTLVQGAKKVESLKDNDIVLISEGCTHHRQCEDIGAVKIPKWLQNYTGKKLNFEFSSGQGFPDDLQKYALIVHCGACMLNEAQMRSRLEQAKEQNIPIVNYGVLISYLNGILDRSLEVFR